MEKTHKIQGNDVAGGIIQSIHNTSWEHSEEGYEEPFERIKDWEEDGVRLESGGINIPVAPEQCFYASFKIYLSPPDSTTTNSNHLSGEGRRQQCYIMHLVRKKFLEWRHYTISLDIFICDFYSLTG